MTFVYFVVEKDFPVKVPKESYLCNPSSDRYNIITENRLWAGSP